MSTTLTINGAYNSQNGLVGIGSNFGQNDLAGATALNVALQEYLTGVSSSIIGGYIGFINADIVGASTTTAAGANALEEFTNFNGSGVSTAGAASGSYTVASSVTNLIVQAPGTESITGTAAVTNAIFAGWQATSVAGGGTVAGAASNVTYNVTDGQGTVVMAGGSDVINSFASNLTAAYAQTFYATGSTVAGATVPGGADTINVSGLNGSDGANVYADGTATANVYMGFDEAVTVTASDNATAAVVFQLGSTGSMTYINNSSASQTVFSGAYTVAGSGGTVQSKATTNIVDVQGGAGGGYYVGGAYGYNTLIGGTGLVTLQGGGTKDFLEANAYSTVTGNVLFAGISSQESLIASASTGNNLFQLGWQQTGQSGAPSVGDDFVSTAGSGQQTFFIGNVGSTTIDASTTTGASNVFDVLTGTATLNGGAVSISGASIVINNFGAAAGQSVLQIVGGSDLQLGSGGASIQYINQIGGNTLLTLTDGTTIQLNGVNSNASTFFNYNNVAVGIL
jgi:hypothetical protein